MSKVNFININTILLNVINCIYFTSIISSGLGLDSKHENIVFSTVMYRHGERSPYNIFPLDPYNASFWPQGLVQLTNEGKLDLYQLGQWYRQRYIQFLEEGYNSEAMYLTSSDEDRTITSAECFLAGLYPPSGSEIWNSQLLWQPIPVHSISPEADNILALTKPCDRLDYLLKELNEAPWYVEYCKEKEPLFKYLSKLTGYTFSENDVTGSLFNATFVQDTLNLQAKYNMPVPAWFTSSLGSELQEIGLTVFLSYYSTDELIKFEAGVLIGTIVKNMIEKRNGNLERTFDFYSGRLKNVLGLIVALVGFDDSVNLDASIMIELKKYNDDYNVEVLLQYANVSEPQLMKIKHCPSPCSLDQFIASVEKYIIYDWDEECKMSNYNFSSFFIIGLVVLLILLACGIRRYCQNSKGQYEEI